MQSQHASSWTLGQAEHPAASADSNASSGSTAQLLLQTVKAMKASPTVCMLAMRAVHAGASALFLWKWEHWWARWRSSWPGSTSDCLEPSKANWLQCPYQPCQSQAVCLSSWCNQSFLGPDWICHTLSCLWSCAVSQLMGIRRLRNKQKMLNTCQKGIIIF